MVDGIPAEQGSGSRDPQSNPLMSIDPTEIESIDVLKDASATAIAARRQTTVAMTDRVRCTARYAAESGVEAVKAELRALFGAAKTPEEQAGVFDRLEARLTEWAERSLGPARFQVAVVDLGARIDLNSASEDVLLGLFQQFVERAGLLADVDHAGLDPRVPPVNPLRFTQYFYDGNHNARFVITDFVFGLGLFNADNVCVYGTNTNLEEFQPTEIEGSGVVTFTIDHLDLVEGTYKLDVAVHKADGYPYDYHRLLHTFRVKSRTKDVGIYRPRHEWRFSDTMIFSRPADAGGSAAS